MKFEQVLASNTVGVERHRRAFEVCLLKERALGFAQDLRRIGVGFVSDLDAFGGICLLVCVKSPWGNDENDGIRFPPLTPYIILKGVKAKKPVVSRAAPPSVHSSRILQKRGGGNFTKAGGREVPNLYLHLHHSESGRCELQVQIFLTPQPRRTGGEGGAGGGGANRE